MYGRGENERLTHGPPGEGISVRPNSASLLCPIIVTCLHLVA